MVKSASKSAGEVRDEEPLGAKVKEDEKCLFARVLGRGALGRGGSAASIHLVATPQRVMMLHDGPSGY